MRTFALPRQGATADLPLALAAAWLALMLLVVLAAQWLAPYDPAAMDLRARLQPPAGMGGSWAHPLGTDTLGRDLLSRLLHATRLSLACALLGTVTGMIETFDSLQNMDLFSQTGGIAGGISQALITTQFGLTIAIPGLLINGMLNKRRDDIALQLAQVIDAVEVKQLRVTGRAG